MVWLTIVSAGEAFAQGVTLHDDFATPTQLRVCRVFPLEEPDSGFSVVELAEASSDSLTPGRSFTIRFDSTGTVEGLAIFGYERTLANQLNKFAISVRFSPTATGYRVSFPDSPPPGTTLASNPSKEPLTGSDMLHAHDLANWLWSRRCIRMQGP